MPVSTADGQLLRDNDGKPPLELVPPEAVWSIAETLLAGLKKYQSRSWERGMPWTVPYACALRHIFKWFQGQEKDEESGLSHLDHALVNLAMLVTYERRKIGKDDRPALVSPPPGPGPYEEEKWPEFQSDGDNMNGGYR